ncbi:YybH family protein [Sungkyunkwania multivorans]|uniref:YybH family protein n=1 Tax=Sungkyunkwania multivorans TaxID=1173618 RepID=A0ABW3CWK4_9FLAO
MKKLFIPLMLVLCMVAGCKSEGKMQKTAVSKGEECLKDVSNIVNSNEKWKCWMNTNFHDSLQHIYGDTSIKVDASGTVAAGTDAIIALLKKKPFAVDSIYTIKKVKADDRHRFDYEIGGFITANATYSHLLIWNRSSDNIREFEFIAKVDKGQNYSIEIDKRRARWVVLCNLHDAARLVSELYSENAVYFSHKPVIIGHESITQEYQYMNDPNYQLTLHPITVQMVNENLAYEIGQCKGTYNGKYMLVWQRDEQGIWRILVDSNI